MADDTVIVVTEAAGQARDPRFYEGGFGPDLRGQIGQDSGNAAEAAPPAPTPQSGEGRSPLVERAPWATLTNGRK